MIDLQDISSLPIQFDFSEGTFVFNECVKCSKLEKIPLSELTPALLNKTLKYPEIVYEEGENLYEDIDEEVFQGSNLKYEVIVIPAGLLGIEYIKSHIYYSPASEGKYGCMVECLYGMLTVLIQKNKPKDELDFDTSVEKGMMIKLRKGEKIAIPAGYYYTFINTKNMPVIFSRIYKSKGVINYSIISNEQGLAYFAIRKNARTEIVFNPRYKEVPQIERYTPADDPFAIKDKTRPLYEQIKKEMDFFMDSLLAF